MTGVQTCALPISRSAGAPRRWWSGSLSTALTQRQAQINAVLRLPDHQRLGAPADLVDWAVEQAHHQVEAITDAGYPVVGELSKLIPSTDESIPRRMHAARTLPVVLDAIIKTWKESPWPNA